MTQQARGLTLWPYLLRLIIMSRTYVSLLLVVPVLCLLGCSGYAPRLTAVAGDTYRDARGYFECVLPSDGWRVSSTKDLELALWNPQVQSGIALNVTPSGGQMELETLTRHLLIAFDDKKVISRVATSVSGRRAERVILEGTIDGSRVMAETYVVRGDGFVCDIVFWAPPSVFVYEVEIFRKFLDGLHFLEGKGVHGRDWCIRFCTS